jgi:hypothetical protein
MRVPASMIFLGAIALVCIAVPIGLVVISSESKHVLVRDDYYRDGLKLDAYRAREAAFDSLGLSLAMREEGKALVIEAKSRSGGDSSGVDPAVRERLGALTLTLQLRRPENASVDRDVPVTLASTDPLLWAADAGPLRRGRWNIRAVFSDAKGTPVMEQGFAYDATNNGTTEQRNK